MPSDNPMDKTKAAYQALIEQISHPDSPVGIDAAYTHAIIIQYLENITRRLEQIETKLGLDGDAAT